MQRRPPLGAEHTRPAGAGRAPPKSLRLLGRHADAERLAGLAARVSREAAPSVRSVLGLAGVARLLVVDRRRSASSLMPPPPRSSATRRSPRRSDSSRAARAWVPRPTWRPSSSTRIWSACMMVETRWATITTTGVARRPAPARPAAGRRWPGRGPRTSRRTGRCSGLRTSARAMARRWRWPPDTFVPPWAIGASSPPGMARHEVARLGDLERLPQLLVGGVGVGEAQVAGHRAGEQVGLLRHEADAGSTASRGRGRGRRRRRRAPRPTVGVEQARDQVEQGGLARSRCCR